MTLGSCIACNRARALVTFEADPLCSSCFEGTAQEALAAPDVDDGSIALVAMACARLIAAHPLRTRTITIGTPGVSLATRERFATSLIWRGLTCERDDVEGWAQVFDAVALNAAAGIFIERMHAGARS